MEVNNLKICVMAHVIQLVNVYDQLFAYKIFPQRILSNNFIISSLLIQKYV